MPRTAHYVSSTHWDREWYEPFQDFRMRLVSLLDEVFETLEKNPAFKTFVMDGQVIPVFDYLEIRPEKAGTIRRFVSEGRFRLRPWYVLPDEWLVSGESLIRNLKMGIELAEEMGAPSSRAGFACDMFGHISQLPQIFCQMNITGALVWRGIHEKEHGGQLNWKSPDGTVIPVYRFGKTGYCTYAIEVRKSRDIDIPFVFEEAVERLTAFVLEEAKRTPSGPIMLFDGGDHLEIEPATSAMLARANEQLVKQNIRIIHSDLDAYLADLTDSRDKIEKTVIGELRETGRDPECDDEHWLIPGILSSRIHLKQRNAACEDELCLWAEPFSSFAAELGSEYPSGYLRTAWKHLLENQPHDNICGCSVDQVHQDMIYRFDQSMGISSRLTTGALRTIALASAPKERPENSLVLTVFNATAENINEPVDLDIPLPFDWPNRFHEFFGYEDKFSFRLRNADGEEIPYQLTGQCCDSMGFRCLRKMFPIEDRRHVISVTAELSIPTFGYTTLIVEPVDGPVRYQGSMAVSHRSIENEFLHVQAETNGTITITDKRTRKRLEQLLTFEERADIGDDWFHGIAVNDCIYTSAASNADVALVTDGFGKATMRISLTMNVPKSFDFASMVRSESTESMRIVSDITLRRGACRVEVKTTIENTVLDHRIRVLFPTNHEGSFYLCDSSFDVIERPLALAEDNSIRRELVVETRPQVTWTAFGDGKSGLAVVSRGLPESAVRDTGDRPIALTLLRGFRRAHLDNDNPGGQVQGKHTFRYFIVPFAEEVPVGKLFLFGQRVNIPVRSIDLLPVELDDSTSAGQLPRIHSFLSVDGKAVVTSVQRQDGKLAVRLFNPHGTTGEVTLRIPGGSSGARCITLDGRDDTKTTVVSSSNGVTELLVPPKRIATVLI